MHLAKLTMNKYILLILSAFGTAGALQAQENSPISRYGIGNLVPNTNIISRGMGGIAAGIADKGDYTLTYNTSGINFANPASLSTLTTTILDIGGEVDVRTLKSFNPAKRFTSVNTLITYLQLGFPITSKNMKKKNISWGMTLGIRPVSRINYKIEENKRLSGIDSLNTLYEGDGGLNQAFIGTGMKIKGFSFGVNAGYMFGTKSYNTRLTLINDSVFYYRSNTANKTTLGGVFVNAGVQYEFFSKNMKRTTRLGLYGGLQQNLHAERDDIIETFSSDNAGATYRIDSIYEQKGVSGTVKVPGSFGIGFTTQDEHWLYGLDFEMSNWGNYRYYGTKDNSVQNKWTVRGGLQYFPAKSNTPIKKYFSYVKYRAGFYYGNDYVKLSDNKPEYGITLGTGMPLTSLSRIGADAQGSFGVLNTAIELGSRGSKGSNLRENVVRFSIGLSLNARWFIKPKYN